MGGKRDVWEQAANRRLRALIPPAILLGAALARLPGIDPSRLPWHPDEYNFVFWPLRILLGDPNPGVFYYPHLHFYLLGGLNALTLLLPVLRGEGSFEELVVLRYFWTPEAALVAGRVTSVLFALGAVWVLCLIARQSEDRLGAYLPPLLLACCIAHVRQSPLAGADMPMGFWFLCAVWAALRLLRAPSLRAHLLAGAFVGLAAATKYHGAAAALPVLAASLLARQRPAAGHCLAAGAAALVVFSLCSPYCLLDLDGFVSGLRAVVDHVEAGRGDLGPAWRYHAATTLRLSYGWAGWVLTGLGLVLAARHRRPRDLVLLSAFCGFFALIGIGRLPFLRYAVPLLPLQALFIWRGVAAVPRLALALALLVMIEPVYGSVSVARLQAATDSRIEAGAWLGANAAAGSVCCNFGGWVGDPQVRTFEDVWWKLSQLVAGSGTPSVDEVLKHLDPHPPPDPFYHYVIQRGNIDQAAGSLAAVTAFGCDYVILHRHALDNAAVGADFRTALMARADLAVHVHGNDPATDQAHYDPIDAFFVPVARFAGVARPGPDIEIWRSASLPAAHPRPWTARQVFARALMRGAASVLDQGYPEVALDLIKQSLGAVPASRDGWLFGEAARLFDRLGEPAAAARSRARAREAFDAVE